MNRKFDIKKRFYWYFAGVLLFSFKVWLTYLTFFYFLILLNNKTHLQRVFVTEQLCQFLKSESSLESLIGLVSVSGCLAHVRFFHQSFGDRECRRIPAILSGIGYRERVELLGVVLKVTVVWFNCCGEVGGSSES